MNETIPREVIWVNPDTLQHVYCTVIGILTEYSCLVQFEDYDREVYNEELREIE